MIKPKKLILHNVCQHTYRELKYSPGITGITGRNGAGKSNLVTAAQYFAVTGKMYNCNKSDMLNWDATKGRTEFYFEYNGEQLTLTRSVSSSTVKLVSESGNVDLKGADAAAFMQEALGADPSTILQTCWCPQGALGSILKMTDTERLKLFQQLAGVQEAEKIRKVILEQLGRLPSYPDRSEDISRIRTEIPLAQAQLAEAERSRDVVRTTLTKYKTAYHEQIAVRSLKLSTDQQTVIDQRKAYIKEAEEKLAQFRASNASILQRSAEPPPGLTETEIFAQASFRELPRLQKALEDAEKAVAAFEDAESIHPVDTFTKPIADLTANIIVGETRLEAIKDGKCPTCGSAFCGEDIHSIGETVVHWTESLRDMQRQRDVSLQYAECCAARDRARTALDAKEETVKGFSLESLQKKTETYQKWQEEAAQRKAVATDMGNLEATVRKQQEYLAIEEAVQTATPEEKVAADKVILLYETKQAELTTLEGAVATHTSTIANLTSQLDMFQGEDDKRLKYDKVRKRLTEVRDAFHISKAPRLVMSKLLIGLNARIMKYLGTFEVEFSAYVNDKFQIICRFHGGKEIQADRLSGGQSVALAIALRFALSDLLGGNLPILVMDEPTAFLDEANIARLTQVLEKVRTTAKRGMFIQVATHEPEIMSAFTKIEEV